MLVNKKGGVAVEILAAMTKIDVLLSGRAVVLHMYILYISHVN